MSDRRQGTVVRRARLSDIDGLVACSSALFAEDAGTRDPNVDTAWPARFGAERFEAGLDDPHGSFSSRTTAGSWWGTSPGPWPGPPR